MVVTTITRRIAMLLITQMLATAAYAQSFEWRSEGRFDASTTPQSAFNTFSDFSIGDVELVDVDFFHTISVLDGGVLQLNDGTFAINASNGDALLGTYNDFRYSPNPAPAEDFTGTGGFKFTGGTGVFEGANGTGSWLAEAAFDPGSSTMGIANHDWTGELSLSAAPANNLYLETFEDGSILDGSPLMWQVFPGFNLGTSAVTDGDLVVEQTGGHSYIPFAAAPAPADVSLKAVLRTEDFMTIVARGDTTTGTAYGGGIRADGNVHIERTHPGSGAGVTTFLATEQTDLRPAEEDIFLQFDLFGEQLDVYAWRVGDAKPETPSVSVTDSTHSNPGPIGFIKCCGSNSSTVQSLQVASVPIGNVVGDFDASNTLSADDIDVLSSAIGSEDAMFDVNLDGVVDATDHANWVNELGGIPFGDANFDGSVTFSDFLALSASFGSQGGWAEGDFNGDGRVGFPDFLILSKNFASGQAQAASISSVPEPTGILLCGLMFCSLGTALRSRRAKEKSSDSCG